MEVMKQKLSYYSIDNTTCLLTLYSLFPPFLTPSSKKRRNLFSSQENEFPSSLFSCSPSFPLQIRAMEQEDWNMICADCVVLSCCCQCLMLQVLVFVLLKLPSKLIKKTAQYMKRKLGIKIRDGRKMVRMKVARCAEEVIGCQKPRESFRVRARGESFRLEGFDGCMEEVEDVLEELSTKGEFGFGSFWRGDGDVGIHFPICLVSQELKSH
uniref:uncharacterized protein LOC122609667 n=1 Tax=Erigeron canadensis TaxID=72917 RepID=UPI001CB99AAE|nr:uncharacterized protein LOC122609667 [Erigeron canadensis]